MVTSVHKYLGIDIGTTSLKAAVFDGCGNRLAVRCVDYTLNTSANGFVEFDAREYVRMCCDVIDALIAECGRIDALSVDTQGETLILTDKNGTPLCPAVVWLDNRAEKEAESIKRKFGNKLVYEVTGQPEITAGWPAAKLIWFGNNKPEIFGKVEKIFLLEDWILYNLTGNFVTEPTIQSSSVYFDITEKDWWDEMLGFIGIRRDMLPRIVAPCTPVGEYRGIKVISGSLDQIAGTIGAGVTDNSLVSEMTGTIMAICAMTDRLPPYREDSIIPCHIHAIDGKYCLILWSSTAGMALKWFRNNFAEGMSFVELDKLAQKVTAGCDGLTMLPYFCGSAMPKYNPSATAVFSGIRLSHTRAHFARSIMESVAFILRQNLEYLGLEHIEEIRITGGGASSQLWSQIKSDVTGKVLKTVSESETACLGAAIFAAVGTGAFPDIESAARGLVKAEKAYTPSGVDYSLAYRNFEEIDCKMN